MLHPLVVRPFNPTSVLSHRHCAGGGGQGLQKDESDVASTLQLDYGGEMLQEDLVTEVQWGRGEKRKMPREGSSPRGSAEKGRGEMDQGFGFGGF